jgi:hypothetical protein
VKLIAGMVTGPLGALPAKLIPGIVNGPLGALPAKLIPGIVNGPLGALPAKLIPGIVNGPLGALPAKLIPGIVSGPLGALPAKLIGGIFTVFGALPVNVIAGISIFDAALEAFGNDARARPAMLAASAVRARALRKLERGRTADIRKRSRGLFAQHARSSGACKRWIRLRCELDENVSRI